MIYNMKQMKCIFVWASIQYAVQVDGATIHVTGPDERQVDFGDGTTSFATLSGGEGYINSSVTVNAPDFVTMTGESVNEMMTLIQEVRVTIASQQVEIGALKQFVGMMPAMPPSTPPTYQFASNNHLVTAVNAWISNQGAALLTYGHISTWDTSLIDSMANLFNACGDSSKDNFNDDISDWDTSAVTSMTRMFYCQSSFNQPIGSWDVSQVKSFSDTFALAGQFNQPLNSWDVSSATDMSYFFQYTDFDQPLNSWDVSRVRYMGAMFRSAPIDQDLSSWDVSSANFDESTFGCFVGDYSAGCQATRMSDCNKYLTYSTWSILNPSFATSYGTWGALPSC